MRAIGYEHQPERASSPQMLPMMPFPLDDDGPQRDESVQPGCTYCYEYGEDKIVDTENGKQPKFMSEETARESVEFHAQGIGRTALAHLTFFGGETLLNFPVLKSTIAYARQRARRARARRSTSA